MLTKRDAERIAGAISLLREAQDWNVPQLMGVLSDPRIRLYRSARDTALALAWLALDEDTRQPTRLFEQGPWWQATGTFKADGPTYRRPEPGKDCDICSLPELECRRRIGGHEFTARPVEPAPMPDHLRLPASDPAPNPHTKEPA